MENRTANLCRTAVTLASVYVVTLALGSGLFILLFRSNLLRSQNVLFNRVLWILIPVSIVVAILFDFVRRKYPVLRASATRRDAWIILLLLFFGNWNTYGMIPFNVSRSNSIILVGYLAASGSTPRTAKEIVDVVNDLYINRHHAIQRRIDEQIAMGNVERSGHGYVLTGKGRLTVWLLNTVTNWFKMDNNFLDQNLYRSAPQGYE